MLLKFSITNNIPSIGIFVLFLGLQLSFIDADPHIDVSTSRGPFSDEGLNTHQVRNFVNLGTWDITEGDNLVKSPLYNTYLAAVMSVFDSSRTTARLSVLIGSMLLLFCFGKIIRLPQLGALFLLIGGLQFHIFQFFHFSMVEMLINGSVLVGIAYAYRYLSGNEPQLKYLLYSLTAFFVCFLLKIQYAYLLPYTGFVWIMSFFMFKNERKTILKHLGYTIILGAFYMSLFYFFWYRPNEVFFELIWNHQGSNRFASIKDWYQTFVNSGTYLIWNSYNQYFALSFLLSLPLGLFLLIQKKSKERLILVLALIWVAFELHKTIILYLPSRYALSLFASMALWLVLVVYLSYLQIRIANLKRSKLVYMLLLLIIITPVSYSHLAATSNAVANKTYFSKKIIEKYNDPDYHGKTVAGVWATSLIWNPTTRVIPIWKNFLNDENILNKKKPPLVVTEKGELDSEGVFRDRSIDLNEISDSSETYEYGPYEISFFHLSY